MREKESYIWFFRHKPFGHSSYIIYTINVTFIYYTVWLWNLGKKLIRVWELFREKELLHNMSVKFRKMLKSIIILFLVKKLIKIQVDAFGSFSPLFQHSTPKKQISFATLLRRLGALVKGVDNCIVNIIVCRVRVDFVFGKDNKS